MLSEAAAMALFIAAIARLPAPTCEKPILSACAAIGAPPSVPPTIVHQQGNTITLRLRSKR